MLSESSLISFLTEIVKWEIHRLGSKGHRFFSFSPKVHCMDLKSIFILFGLLISTLNGGGDGINVRHYFTFDKIIQHLWG